MRADRLKMISSQMQKELAFVLHDEVEPIVGIVSITEIKLSSDGGIADVYILFFGKENIKLLQSRISSMRAKLAKKLKLRYTPQLRFHLDEAALHARKIDELLKQT